MAEVSARAIKTSTGSVNAQIIEIDQDSQIVNIKSQMQFPGVDLATFGQQQRAYIDMNVKGMVMAKTQRFSACHWLNLWKYMEAALNATVNNSCTDKIEQTFLMNPIRDLSERFFEIGSYGS